MYLRFRKGIQQTRLKAGAKAFRDMWNPEIMVDAGVLDEMAGSIATRNGTRKLKPHRGQGDVGQVHKDEEKFHMG